MQEKVVGYLLLIIGIGIILVSGVSVYMVFTKKAQPTTLFTFSGISMDLSQIMSASMPEEVRNLGITVPEVKQEIIPADMVNKPMNLVFHTILMGFIATIGMKLAQVGTMLMRTIIVHVKERKPEEITNHSTI